MSVDVSDLPIVLKAAFGCVLAVVVVRMAIIDCREMILPDRLNAVLAGCGIGQAIFVSAPGLTEAAVGALIGFLILGAIAALFRQVRGIDGLGFGDQKFAAAAGLWIGWEGVAPMLLIASCSALAFVTIRSATQPSFDVGGRIPFGPFLGLGTVACWLITVAPGS